MPHYPIDAVTEKIVLGFLNKARELDMGNVNFHYYTPGVDFYLEECKEYWELIVKSGQNAQGELTDVYRIDGDELKFRYSEQD